MRKAKGRVSSTFLITGSFSSTADIHSMITAVTAAAFVPFSSSSSFVFCSIVSTFTFLSAIPEKSALLENIRNFFLTFVWLPLNFSPFWPQPWTDFVGPISAQLGFALGYYCQWRSKNRSHRKKWGDWVTCLSLAILALGPLFNYLQ